MLEHQECHPEDVKFSQSGTVKHGIMLISYPFSTWEYSN